MVHCNLPPFAHGREGSRESAPLASLRNSTLSLRKITVGAKKEIYESIFTYIEYTLMFHRRLLNIISLSLSLSTSF